MGEGWNEKSAQRKRTRITYGMISVTLARVSAAVAGEPLIHGGETFWRGGVWESRTGTTFVRAGDWLGRGGAIISNHRRIDSLQCCQSFQHSLFITSTMPTGNGWFVTNGQMSIRSEQLKWFRECHEHSPKRVCCCFSKLWPPKKTSQWRSTFYIYEF